jgi:hypothetical protein
VLSLSKEPQQSTAAHETSSEPKRPASKSVTAAKQLGSIVTAVVVLAILLAVGLGVNSLVRGTWTVNPVLSGSMRLGLAVGGAVITERVPVDQLAIRDVIVFRDPNDPSEQIVHRIIAMNPGHQENC